MRLVSVECENFRQYKNLKLTFPKSSDFDIHVIEASNGVGKTNLLNAINWCLYGDEPHRSGMLQRDVEQNYSDDSNRLPLYNIEVFKEYGCEGKTICKVVVSVVLDIDGEQYTFKRTREFKVPSGVSFGKEVIECSKKTSTGSTVYIYGVDINLKIMSVLPRDIREYFYFDGEQLLTYFSEGKRQNVRDKVYTIAQINILDEVKGHLSKIVGQYKAEYTKNDPNLGKKEKDAADAKTLYEDKKEHLKKIDSEIIEAKKVIDEINSEISGFEYVAELNNSYEAEKKLLEAYKLDLLRLENLRDEFIQKSIVKVLLYQTNKNAVDYITKRKEYDDSITDVRESDLQHSIESCECILCHEKLNRSKVELMKALLQKIKGNTSALKIATILPLAREGLKIEDFKTEKAKVLFDIEEKTKQIEELEASIDEKHSKLMKYGTNAAEDVAKKIHKKDEFESRLEKKKEEKLQYSIQKDNLEKDYLKKKDEYDRALKQSIEHEATKKYWEFAEKSYDVLEKVIEDLTRTARNSIAKRTEELFKDLIWKKGVYGRVELSDDYGIKLYHEYNDKSCLDSCSASETELLALAFTLAVHEISGYDSFLLIDTPVGRVSDDNRKNFAKVLLDISTKKQIVLEVTPSEYSDEIKDILNAGVLSSYTRLYLKNNSVEKER